MKDLEPADIESVAVEPTYCHHCGTELQSREFEGSELGWCPDCRRLFSRNPVPGLQVVVRDGDRVLLVDEPYPDDDYWNLPGGHAGHDEEPEEVAARELEEETGLRADPADLSLLTVYRVEATNCAYYDITYSVERSETEGELVAGEEVSDAGFWAVEEVVGSDRAREAEREAIEMAFER